MDMSAAPGFLVPGFPYPPPILGELREIFRLKPKIPLSEWSEANIVLSPEYSNSTGPLMLFGWQRAIFDAITDPAIETVVIMSSTQVVKSLAIMCAIAYWIAEDPGPILLVEPKKDAARDFSKRRLMPLTRDCTVLHGRISDSVHDGHNTIQSKDFPGGNLLIVSARTPVDLAQHTIRYLVCDEIDKYDDDVGGSAEHQGEGDPVDLAWERAMTFGSRRKRVLACSPTIAGQSRIGKAWALSDQRRPWVPCPYCGAMQVLRFRDRDGYHVKWDSSVARELQAKSARYHCVRCDRPWTEQERWTAANHHVEWRPDKPGGTDGNIAGFWVNHFYVPPTWKTAVSITNQFLGAKDDRQTLKTFINTVLAEEWVEEGVAPEKDLLYGRREGYAFGDTAVVPQRGLFLTAAADVQENPPRLEVEIKAWGRGRENWSMGYWILQAFAPNGQELPVSASEVWDLLDELLYRDWPHESGHSLPILCISIDTGKNPKPVYEFARRPGHHQLHYGPQGIKIIAARTVVPVKGTPDMLRIISSVSKEDAARKRQGVRIVGIGTNCAKAEIFDLLRHAKPNPDDSPSHGCYHFPMYDMVYFEGLTSEVKIVKTDGNVVYEKRGPRNEPVDLAVYNRGAAAIVGIDRMGEGHWQRFEKAVEPIGDSAHPRPAPQPQPAPAAPTQAAPAAPVTIQPGGIRPVRGGFFRRD
jgi:phage terminase large subunit GpA-like protein